ncbi:mechanosensitive ion channel family protein [Candidatus Woesearchaeota archaeon]|nr:mechanosensitive ion channel family protein [Candidatus Woesearchaeota archaeon]
MAEWISNAMIYLNNIFSQFFIKFIVSIIILLIGFIIGRTVEKILQKILHEVELNKNIKKAGIKFPIENIISSFTKYFIYFIAVIWALTELGLTTTVLNMISAVILVLILISLVLAIKDFIPNIIAGFFIHRKRMFKQGDNITVKDLKGIIQKITLTETEIKTEKGDIIYIPNSIIKKEVVIKKK